MVVFDSNIFIYAGSDKLKRALIDDADACYASITKIEVLGYHKITVGQARALARILDSYQMICLSDSIIQLAIALRQSKKLGLGDAVVAATAIDQGCDLWTANSQDFKDIPDLTVDNPFKADNQ